MWWQKNNLKHAGDVFIFISKQLPEIASVSGNDNCGKESFNVGFR